MHLLGEYDVLDLELGRRGGPWLVTEEEPVSSSAPRVSQKRRKLKYAVVGKPYQNGEQGNEYTDSKGRPLKPEQIERIRLKREPQDGTVESLEPEDEEGNVEYKLRLKDPHPVRLQQLITQLKFRLAEGEGEAFYYIGVEDNGYPKGLEPQELQGSMATLDHMAASLNASTSVVKYLRGAHGRKCVLVRVARNTVGEVSYTDLRVAVAGSVDAGKSTLVAVLTHGSGGRPMLDNGRGTARMNVFRHKHEIESGRTSSISRQILGYDKEGRPLNYGGDQTSGTQKLEDFKAYIPAVASKLVTFIDMGGHAKHLKTALYGMTCLLPDYTLLAVCCASGLARITREHMALAVALEVPVAVVLTKPDCVGPQRMAAVVAEVRQMLALLQAAGAAEPGSGGNEGAMERQRHQHALANHDTLAYDILDCALGESSNAAAGVASAAGEDTVEDVEEQRWADVAPLVQSEEHAVEVAKRLCSLTAAVGEAGSVSPLRLLVPLIPVSSVTGSGLGVLHAFLSNLLPAAALRPHSANKPGYSADHTPSATATAVPATAAEATTAAGSVSAGANGNADAAKMANEQRHQGGCSGGRTNTLLASVNTAPPGLGLTPGAAGADAGAGAGCLTGDRDSPIAAAALHAAAASGTASKGASCSSSVLAGAEGGGLLGVFGYGDDQGADQQQALCGPGVKEVQQQQLLQQPDCTLAAALPALDPLPACGMFCEDAPLHFQVDSTFDVGNVGPVVAGTVVQGVVRCGQRLMLGPTLEGGFQPVIVSGIQRSQVPVKQAKAGQMCTIALAPAPNSLTMVPAADCAHDMPTADHANAAVTQADTAEGHVGMVAAAAGGGSGLGAGPSMFAGGPPAGGMAGAGSGGCASGDAPLGTSLDDSLLNELALCCDVNDGFGADACDGGSDGFDMTMLGGNSVSDNDAGASHSFSGADLNDAFAGLDLGAIGPEEVGSTAPVQQRQPCQSFTSLGHTTYSLSVSATGGIDISIMGGSAAAAPAHKPAMQNTAYQEQHEAGAGERRAWLAKAASSKSEGNLLRLGGGGGGAAGGMVGPAGLASVATLAPCGSGPGHLHRLATSPSSPALTACSPPNSRKGAVLLDASIQAHTSWEFEAVLVLLGGHWPARGLLTGRWPPACDETMVGAAVQADVDSGTAGTDAAVAAAIATTGAAGGRRKQHRATMNASGSASACGAGGDVGDIGTEADSTPATEDAASTTPGGTSEACANSSGSGSGTDDCAVAAIARRDTAALRSAFQQHVGSVAALPSATAEATASGTVVMGSAASGISGTSTSLGLRASLSRSKASGRAGKARSGDYTYVVHCGSVRQTARIVAMQEVMEAGGGAVHNASAFAGTAAGVQERFVLSCQTSGKQHNDLANPDQQQEQQQLLPGAAMPASSAVSAMLTAAVPASIRAAAALLHSAQKHVQSAPTAQGVPAGGCAVPGGASGGECEVDSEIGASSRQQRTARSTAGGGTAHVAAGDVCCLAHVVFRFAQRPEWLREGAKLIVRDRADGHIAGAGYVRRSSV